MNHHTSPDDAEDIILLVNIGDASNFHRLTPEAAKAEGCEREPLACLEVSETIDPDHIPASQWRRIARRLDELVDEADRHGQGRSVHYLVMGRAPVPIFAYLGQRMRRMCGPITVINQVQGTSDWNHVGLLPRRDDAPQAFSLRAPDFHQQRHGWVGLSVRCSSAYPYDEPQAEEHVEGYGGTLLGTYHLVCERSHRTHPLDVEELQGLLDRLDEVLVGIRKAAIAPQGCLLAIAGPAWVAFWVGHRLNPNVVGQIHLPYYRPHTGYLPALASPMYRALCYHGRAKILVLGAETDDTTDTEPGRLRDAIERVKAALGPLDRYDLEFCEATRHGQVLDLLTEHEPDIVHVWTHGSQTGEVALENARGDMTVLSPDAFVDLLAQSGRTIGILVLGACHLAALAERLKEHANCIIATHEPHEIDRGIAFAEGFYGELARSESIGQAFEEGQARYRANPEPGIHGAAARQRQQTARRVAEGMEITFDEVTKSTTPLFPRAKRSRGTKT